MTKGHSEQRGVLSDGGQKVTTIPLTATQVVDNLFKQKGALAGGIVRRKKHYIDRLVGADKFRAAVAERGFHMFVVGADYVIFCVKGDIDLKLVC